MELSDNEIEELHSTLKGERKVEDPPKKPKSKTKRSTADIREEMINQGCLFLDFKTPPNTSSAWVKEWNAIAKYGFFVTAEGCIMPYSYYRKTTKAGDSLSGHIRSAHFFFNRTPDRRQLVNQFGWPMAEEVSHLCHNPDCCNPLHICIEARWKNWKRHYCGEKGSCDCGRDPPCVRTYTNPEVFKQQSTLENDAQKAKEILSLLQQRYPFVIRPKTWYTSEDSKSKNRQERKRKQKKHEAEADKKAAKKLKKSE